MKTVIRPETEMKDSGIEWIGDIPSSWTIFPANGVFSEVKEKNTDLKFTNAFSFKYGEIVDKKQVGDVDNNLKETLSSYTIVRKNTIMINGLNLNYDFVSQRVAIVNESGIITSAYLAIQPDENKINPRFVLYLLKSYDYQQVFHGLGSGIRKTLKYQDFKKIMIVAPTLSEQQVIADYLDKTCSQIDEIIAEAKASIDEYKELKQSIIFEAVTKGLDKNVDMRDSGVEWIGAIPKTWDVLSLKYMCTMQAGKNLISEQIADSGKYSVYGGNGLRGYYSSYNTEGRHLLVGRQGALCGNVHDVDGQYWCTEHAIVTTETKFSDIDYLFYLLIGMNLNQYASNAAAQPGLSVGNILNVKTVKPSMDEQKEIATYLKNILPKYNSLITEKESLINDLEAYKKSLIYEVVTGKRRVV